MAEADAVRQRMLELKAERAARRARAQTPAPPQPEGSVSATMEPGMPPAPPSLELPAPGTFNPTPRAPLEAPTAAQESLARLPLLFGSGLATGTPGMVGDVLNLGQLVGGPAMPFGTEGLQQALGLPQPRTGLERGFESVGQALSPAAYLAAAGWLGVPATTIAALTPWLTSGVRGDIAMGGAGWLGSEIGDALTRPSPNEPGTPMGRAIGGLAGPLAVAAGHRLASGAVQKLGAGARNRQDIAAAQRQVEAATQARQAVTQGAEEAFTGLEAGLRPAIGTTAPSETVAGQLAQRAAMTRMPAEQARIQGNVDRLVTTISPKLERLDAIGQMAQGYKTVFRESKKALGKLFDATEQLTGDAPVVTLPSLHSKARTMLEETAQTGQGVPRGTRTIATTGLEEGGTEAQRLAAAGAIGPAVAGLPREDFDALLQTPGFFRGLTAQQRTLVQQYLQGGTQEAGVPFWLARRMESALREMAYPEGGKPVGNLGQGRARELYWALSDDLRRFYQETPEGEQIQPALRTAKDAYIKFVDLFNRTITKRLLDDRPGVRETFVRDFLRRPTEELLTIRRESPPAQWQQVVSGVLDEQVRNAMAGAPQGQFDPAKLVGVNKRLQQQGKIDVLMTPEQKAVWNAIVQDASALSTRPDLTLATQIAKKSPDKVISTVFAPGNLGTTQTYKQMTDTQTYDQMVKAWMDQFLRDATTMDAGQIYRKLKPLVREDADGASQLRLMLEQYPEALTAVETAVKQYERMPGRITAAQAEVQRAQEGLRAARERAGLEGKGAESAHGYMHAPGFFMRVGPSMAGAMAALNLALTGHPKWAAASMIGGVGIDTFRWWTNNTTAGQRAIRQGFPTPYLPTAVRTGAQAGAQPPVPVPSSAVPFAPGATGAPAQTQGGSAR